MKKTVFIALVSIFSFTMLNAQQGKGIRDGRQAMRGQEFRKGPSLNLSEEQKEKMKDLKLEFAKNTLDSKNELRELTAEYRTLMSGDNQDLKAIDKNIENRQQVKTVIMKEKSRLDLNVRKILTEEQRIIIDSHRRPKAGPGQRRPGA